MHIIKQVPARFAYHIALLVLGTTLLSSCDQSQQLGIEDNPQELLERKLSDPDTMLTSDQSISLVNHCEQLGEQNETNTANKVVDVFMGNTGTGKSTTISYLAGCTMTIENENNMSTEEREKLQRELAQLKSSTKEPPTTKSTK